MLPLAWWLSPSQWLYSIQLKIDYTFLIPKNILWQPAVSCRELALWVCRRERVDISAFGSHSFSSVLHNWPHHLYSILVFGISSFQDSGRKSALYIASCPAWASGTIQNTNPSTSHSVLAVATARVASAAHQSRPWSWAAFFKWNFSNQNFYTLYKVPYRQIYHTSQVPAVLFMLLFNMKHLDSRPVHKK